MCSLAAAPIYTYEYKDYGGQASAPYCAVFMD